MNIAATYGSILLSTDTSQTLSMKLKQLWSQLKSASKSTFIQNEQ